MKLKGFIFFSVILMAFSSAVLAKDVIRYSQNGAVNWSKGFIDATGKGVSPEKYKNSPKGRLLARRAAQVDAYRNLAEIVNGVKVTSEQTVNSLGKKSTVTKTLVEGVIKGAVLIDEAEENGVYSVTLRINTSGKYISAILDGLTSKEKKLSWLNFSLFSQANAALLLDDQSQYDFAKIIHSELDVSTVKSLKAKLSDAMHEYEKVSSKSGIVIDARHIPHFEPASFPSLVDALGNKLYKIEELSEEALIVSGGFIYVGSMQDALQHEIVKKTPLVFKAKSIYNNLSSDLVIDKDAFLQLKSIKNREKNIILDAKIVIII